MKEVVIYVEGGGDTAAERAELRGGFDLLFRAAKQAARAKRLRWNLVPSGGRDQAYRAFAARLEQSDPADTLVVLLVDSEEPLAGERPAVGGETEAERERRESVDAQARKDHLAGRDPSWDLKGVEPENIHLMVQCMEAWIAADADALAEYYGQGFHAKSLPNRGNLEDEPKTEVYDKLEKATKGTRKGAYAKIRHASKLLGLIDPAQVARRCPRFATFAAWLTHKIDTA